MAEFAEDPRVEELPEVISELNKFALILDTSIVNLINHFSLFIGRLR